MLLTDREMIRLHARFLRKGTRTDVMTFVDGEQVDIAISLDQALRQARPRALTLFHEIALLICHGLLHAKGFDDTTEAKALEMRKKEWEWMARVL